MIGILVIFIFIKCNPALRTYRILMRLAVASIVLPFVGAEAEEPNELLIAVSEKPNPPIIAGLIPIDWTLYVIAFLAFLIVMLAIPVLLDTTIRLLWQKWTDGGVWRALERTSPPMLADSKAECAICLEETLGSLIRSLRCKHRYHKECIDIWLKQPLASRTCPMCRAEVRC